MRARRATARGPAAAVAQTAPGHAYPPGHAAPPSTAGALAGILWGQPVRRSLIADADILAHERVHEMQVERFGARGAPGTTTEPDAPDEVEARALAPLVARGEAVSVRQPPTAALQLWTREPGTLPSRLELIQAVERLDEDRVIDILAAHYQAGTIAELYGPTLVRRLMPVFARGRTKTLWSLARTYLGSTLTLSDRIKIDDKVFGQGAEEIIREIRTIPDEEALRVVLGDEPLEQGWQLDDVRQALSAALSPSRTYQALDLLYAKAARAGARSGLWTWTVDLGPHGTVDLGPASRRRWAFLDLRPELVRADTIDWTALGGQYDPTDIYLGLQPGDIPQDVYLGPDGTVWIDPADIPGIPQVPPEEPAHLEFEFPLDPVSRLRVDLAYEKVAREDEATEGIIFKDPAPRFGAVLLAVGVLHAAERKALWQRLSTRRWVGLTSDQVETLHQLALCPDDALVLERAVTEADRELYYRNPFTVQVNSYGPEMAVAARTAQDMIAEAGRSAREAADLTSRDMFEQEQRHAQVVFRSPQFQSALGAYPEGVGQLASLGADPAAQAMQQLRGVDSAAQLFEVVAGVPTGQLGDASLRSAVRYKAEWLELDAQDRQALEAFLDVGRDPAAINQVALYRMRTALEDDRPSRALALMHRMTPEQRAAYVHWQPYQDWFRSLADEGDEGRWLYIWLGKANRGNTVEALRGAAVAYYWQSPDAPPRLRDKDAYAEWLAARGGDAAGRRRGFVLWTRLRDQPGLKLTPQDLAAVDAYAEHRRLTGDLSWAERNSLDDVYFGQPQVVTTAEAAVDPTAEADYMFQRVAGRRHLRSTWRTVADDVRRWRGEYLGHDVTEFLLTYGTLRAGSIGPADLVILADLYHRAMRESDEILHQYDTAASVASIVGCVVGVTVATVLSGGTLGPVAVGAVAILAGGAAAATAGALLRPESTGWDVLRDFGTGAIEGAMAVAGAGIAARVVRAMGLAGTAGTLEVGTASAAAVEASTGARAAAHIASAVIDGAVSNAAGEVFRTATDEATWDRSTSEALTRVLAAIARGAAQGAAGGVVFAGGLTVIGAGISRIAQRFGNRTAAATVDLASASGLGLARFEALSHPAQDGLAAATERALRGDIDGALAIVRRVEELSLAEAGQVRATLRAIRVRQAALEAGVEAAEIDRRITVIDPGEFARRTHGQRGNAVLEFTEDGPHIVLRSDVDPLVVREEVRHIQQWVTDPVMRARMERVARQTPQSWAQLSASERGALLADKLEVEADAQRRIIADLEQHAAAGDVDAADEIAAAEDTLRSIGVRLDEVRAAPAVAAVAAGPPRFFSKTAPTTGGDPTKAANWAAVQQAGVIGADPNEKVDKLKALGYQVTRDRGGTGRVWRITRPSGKAATNEMAQLTIVETIDERGMGRFEIQPGRPRLTWAERQRDAGRRFRAEREGIRETETTLATGGLAYDAQTELQKRLQALRPDFVRELQGRIDAGTLDEASAGLLAPWGENLDILRRRSDLSYGEMLDEMLDRVLGARDRLTQADYDRFRRSLRALGADAVAELPSGTARRKLLDALLKAQPDSKSKGELFSEFLRRKIPSAGERHVLDVPFEAPRLPSRRQPDEVAFGPDLDNLVPRGMYAVEHKAGRGAFKLDQAEDYARAFAAPGGPVSTAGSPLGWDGLVYVFSTKGEAEAALRLLQESATTKPLLDVEHGRIRVLFVDDRGTLNSLARETGSAL